MENLIMPVLFIFAFLASTIMTILVIVAIYFICCGMRGIKLADGLPGAFDDSEQFLEEEASALELMDDRSKQSYLTAKRWIEHNPPNSADTDISLSQYMTIQEKAVAAWEFTFDILQQPFVLVRSRTELEFRGIDDVGCIQTNLPLPKQKEVYYWEVKIYDMDPDTRLSVGLTTKPYPVFRLPGMHRYSVAYESTATRRLNQPFKGVPYGRTWQRGDVIGVGYRTRSGTIFFTHNGQKLDDVVHGMRLNVFPTVGATGPANVYVNLGQDGFVFIQANVKEWGLAPAQGSLAPPPAYGAHDDSLLLESTGNPGSSSSQFQNAPPYVRSRSNDNAHDSIEGESSSTTASQVPSDLHTPPGSPPSDNPLLNAVENNSHGSSESTDVNSDEQQGDSDSTVEVQSASTSENGLVRHFQGNVENGENFTGAAEAAVNDNDENNEPINRKATLDEGVENGSNGENES